MTQKPDNPQAFPHMHVKPSEPYSMAMLGGMTLRDYFAAAALQGILARPNTPAEYDAKSVVAIQCYDYADFMLKAREETHD